MSIAMFSSKPRKRRTSISSSPSIPPLIYQSWPKLIQLNLTKTYLLKFRYIIHAQFKSQPLSETLQNFASILFICNHQWKLSINLEGLKIHLLLLLLLLFYFCLHNRINNQGFTIPWLLPYVILTFKKLPWRAKSSETCSKSQRMHSLCAAPFFTDHKFLNSFEGCGSLTCQMIRSFIIVMRPKTGLSPKCNLVKWYLRGFGNYRN